MHLSDPDAGGGMWRQDTWSTSRRGALQHARPSVLVVGEGALAGRVLRRCRTDRRVLLAGPRAPSADAAATIAEVRPDFALLCGAVDDRTLGTVTSQLEWTPDPPTTVLALVALVGGRIRALPLREVTRQEEALLDELAGGRLWVA